MLFGPILSAELIPAARRRRYFLLRVLYASLLLVVFFGTFAATVMTDRMMRPQEAANYARRFFVAFSSIQVLAVLALGPAISASLIARERERRTIEYLFASPLRNSEVVLGKLGAALIKLAAMLAVGLPILSMAMLMGGIGPDQLLAVFAITLSTMLVVSGISTLVSTTSRRARDAVIRSYLLIVALLFLPMMASGFGVFSGWSVAESILRAFMDANPLIVTPQVLQGDWGQTDSPLELLRRLVINQMVVAVGTTVLSVVIVRWSYVRSMGKASNARSWRLRLPRPGVSSHAMLWKELFAEESGAGLGFLGRIVGMLIVVSVLGAAGYQFYEYVTNPTQYFAEQGVFMSLTFCGGFLSLLLFLTVGVRACTSITREQDRETWLTLISTPLTGREILTGKLLGSLYGGRFLLLSLVPLWMMGAMVDARFLGALILVIGTLVILSVFSASLGMFFSLWCKTSTRAIAATLTVLLTMGGGYLLCCGFCIVPLAMLAIGPSEGEMLTVVMTAPVMTYLAGFPYVLLNMDFEMRGEGLALGSYILGNVLYLAATGLLLSGCYYAFDRLAGRTDVRGSVPRRPDNSSKPAAQVILMDGSFSANLGSGRSAPSSDASSESVEVLEVENHPTLDSDQGGDAPLSAEPSAKTLPPLLPDKPPKPIPGPVSKSEDSSAGDLDRASAVGDEDADESGGGASDDADVDAEVKGTEEKGAE